MVFLGTLDRCWRNKRYTVGSLLEQEVSPAAPGATGRCGPRCGTAHRVDRVDKPNFGFGVDLSGDGLPRHGAAFVVVGGNC
jgi:hypothetical protein